MVDTIAKKPGHKRSANISLSPDVYDGAKRLGINLSQTCDRLLRQVIRDEEARRWSADNAAFIDAYNKVSEAEGLPLDHWRSF